MFIPNCSFLEHFGGTSGEFRRATVHILVRHSQVESISMASPDEPDMTPKSYQNDIRYLLHPN